MQDIHCIGGGRGDRWLRPLHPQALNCPRCDSLSTKFCYYNNYNLSQPRHYCKNCRRYWTKGGVLRNVPVGGGCRKAKRNKPKSTESAVIAPPEQVRKFQVDHAQSNSRSGSEGSSLTAVAIIAVNSSSGGAAETMDSRSECNRNPNFGLGAGSLDCGLFSEIGDFPSLVSASTSNETMSFEYGTMSNQHRFDQVHGWQNQNQNQNEETRAGVLADQTVQSRSDGGDFGLLDWPGNGNQELFDFSNAVDQTYWNQHQWIDQDQSSIYL